VRDLQKLSNARIREARVLFNAGEYSGACYLAGYSVECALKACFAKSVKRYDFPHKESKDVLTHRLREIVKVAKLSNELFQAERSNPKFASGWEVVCRWNEESRYHLDEAGCGSNAGCNHEEKGWCPAMDQAALVSPDLEAGGKVLAVLEEAQIKVPVAALVVCPEYGDWRLVLSSPSLDQTHLLRAHAK
jgi:HEPN domain-containing protein